MIAIIQTVEGIKVGRLKLKTSRRYLAKFKENPLHERQPDVHVCDDDCDDFPHGRYGGSYLLRST